MDRENSPINCLLEQAASIARRSKITAGTLEPTESYKRKQIEGLISFANSCNASFVNIGLHLDPSKYRTTADSLLFNKKLPSQLPAKKSQFVVDKDTGPGEMMMTAMGQGNTQISPYHLALIGCAVANDGLLMKPYLVTEINNDQNKNVKKYSPKSYKQLLSAEEAAVLQRYMRSVVTDGTGRALNSGSYTAAAKTGTAAAASRCCLSCWSTSPCKRGTATSATPPSSSRT
jgi:cell division protein FtsI/penicillin-binding protein 2